MKCLKNFLYFLAVICDDLISRRARQFDLTDICMTDGENAGELVSRIQQITRKTPLQDMGEKVVSLEEQHSLILAISGEDFELQKDLLKVPVDEDTKVMIKSCNTCYRPRKYRTYRRFRCSGRIQTNIHVLFRGPFIESSRLHSGVYP